MVLCSRDSSYSKTRPVEGGFSNIIQRLIVTNSDDIYIMAYII